jgi:hypothetical protein
MPYPLLLEDSSRISRRRRRREELLECFRLLREGDANDRELAQRLSTDQRAPLQELSGIYNTHRQQEMVPPSQHFRHYSNTLFVDTRTDSTMQHEAKRRRVTCTPSIVTKPTTQHDIHPPATTKPSEHKAKKRCVTFAPTIATFSTLPQQYEQEGSNERKQQISNFGSSMNRRYMTENDFEPAYSRYPRMRASSLALPDLHFAQTNNATAHFGRAAAFPSGPPLREGNASQQQPYYTSHLASDLRRPLYSAANPRMYSFAVDHGKPASLLPPHPLGNRAAVAALPPITHGTKRRAL